MTVLRILYFYSCISLLITFAATTSAYSQSRIDSLINTLQEEIDAKNKYVNARLERIEKIKKEGKGLTNSSLKNRFDLYNNLYHEYKVFIYDSAFRYANKLIQTAYQLKDSSLINYAKVKLGFILVSSGMFKETFDSLERISARQLPDSTKIDFYYLMARSYNDLSQYNNDNFYTTAYRQRANLYSDSAIASCEPGSYRYLYLKSGKDLSEQKFEAAKENINKILTSFELSYPQYAVNYHDLSFVYRGFGDEEKTVEYLIRSASSDIRAATKETAAMYNLARLLYERGDLMHAYTFIKEAMDDAQFYGARQRKLQIGSILPLIANEKVNSTEEQRKKWLKYSIALGILSLLTLTFAFIIIKQLKKLQAAELTILKTNESLKHTNQTLQEANSIKEEYIGYYFNSNSEYLDKIENFKKAIEAKLAAKKTDEIKFVVNGINLAKEREALYSGFDKVFLKLFPDFVQQFNNYFEDKDKIILKEGELLNTELRIFALIRMGISDTEKIAKILDYSVNTIYAYKTRVRSKSVVPNEEFDHYIMEIKSA